MSRQSPFPTNSARRPRSPVQPNVYDASSSPVPSNVRPLQIGRPSSRPNTPSNSSLANSSPRSQSFASSNGPSRPQRSDMRSRQVSEYSNDDRASSSSRPPRDSASTTRSDASQSNTYRTRNGSTTTARSTPKSRSNGPTEVSPISPGSAAAIAAFQNAGQRKRAQTNGSDDYEYDRERRKEREREQLVQQRMKEKQLGRRPNGKVRAGDIDGTFYCLLYALRRYAIGLANISKKFLNIIYSCSGSDQGRMGVCDRPGREHQHSLFTCCTDIEPISSTM